MQFEFSLALHTFSDSLINHQNIFAIVSDKCNGNLINVSGLHFFSVDLNQNAKNLPKEFDFIFICLLFYFFSIGH